MDVLLLVLLALAIFHFVYEGIIAPHLRIRARNKMFGLRDELREVRHEQSHSCPQNAFAIAQEGMNNFLEKPTLFTLSMGFRYRSLREQDPEFRVHIRERRAIVEQCENADYKRIVKDANQVMANTFLVNMGAWFIYIVPMALVFFGIHTFMRWVKSIFALPGNDADRLEAAFT